MSHDMIGGTIVATSVWVIFAAGVLGLTPLPLRSQPWVAAASASVARDAEIIRVAHPSGAASAQKTRAGKTIPTKG